MLFLDYGCPCLKDFDPIPLAAQCAPQDHLFYVLFQWELIDSYFACVRKVAESGTQAHTHLNFMVYKSLRGPKDIILPRMSFQELSLRPTSISHLPRSNVVTHPSLRTLVRPWVNQSEECHQMSETHTTLRSC